MQYETGLRLSTIDALEVPTHWHKGSRTLTLTDELDKSRWGRDLPLTDTAVAALESVCPPEGGLLLGGHDYRDHVAEAASMALPKAVAAKFTGRSPALGADNAPTRKRRELGRRGVPRRASAAHDDQHCARPSFAAGRAVLEAFAGHKQNTGGRRRRGADRSKSKTPGKSRRSRGAKERT